MSSSESAGPFGPGGAFERLGVLETLSYGMVWQGKHFQASQAEPLAFLELDRAFQRDRDVFERLLDALAMAVRLSGAGVALSHGVWRDGDSFYVVAEDLAGLSLARACEVLAAVGARLSTEAILRVTGAVLSALDQAAKQFPGSEEAPYGHGLLTPENIFLAEGQRVLVRGFGVWPAVSRAGLLRPTEARYLAPAQLRTGLASPRSDLFSLATILFELVCGIPAFDGSPDDEGVSSLKETIEERQKEAEAPLLPLYSAMLACLSSGLPAPVFRSRLRKSMDTLFLEEFPRERGAKSFSVEDLLGRVKPRRPAVVKARPLALEPVRAARAPTPPADADPAEAASGGANAPAQVFQTPAVAPAPPPPAFSSGALPQRRVPKALWLGALVVAAGVLAAIILKPRVSSEPPPPQSPRAAELGTPAPASTPPLSAAAAAVSKAEPVLVPTAVERLLPAETSSSRRKRQETAAAPATRSQPAADPTGSRQAEPPGPSDTAGSAAAAAPVTRGSLVPLDTPSLARPVLSEAPEMLRYGASDPRPALARTALLEILVDETGRVRGSRILQVDSPPPGFSSGVERYLAGLRFQPARVGEAPVRVWMSYELKYLAP